jgi:hypothetical protein
MQGLVQRYSKAGHKASFRPLRVNDEEKAPGPNDQLIRQRRFGNDAATCVDIGEPRA